MMSHTSQNNIFNKIIRWLLLTHRISEFFFFFIIKAGCHSCLCFVRSLMAAIPSRWSVQTVQGLTCGGPGERQLFLNDLWPHIFMCALFTPGRGKTVTWHIFFSPEKQVLSRPKSLKKPVNNRNSVRLVEHLLHQSLNQNGTEKRRSQVSSLWADTFFQLHQTLDENI